MTCDTCGSAMKPLFISWFCPTCDDKAAGGRDGQVTIGSGSWFCTDTSWYNSYIANKTHMKSGWTSKTYKTIEDARRGWESSGLSIVGLVAICVDLPVGNRHSPFEDLKIIEVWKLRGDMSSWDKLQ